jgi:hypothetical protein
MLKIGTSLEMQSVDELLVSSIRMLGQHSERFMASILAMFHDTVKMFIISDISNLIASGGNLVEVIAVLLTFATFLEQVQCKIEQYCTLAYTKQATPFKYIFWTALQEMHSFRLFRGAIHDAYRMSFNKYESYVVSRL